MQINAARYAACISRKCSAALDHVIVFIDGTLKFQCRPVRGHRAIWNGHKRHHGLKFQCLTAPDGLVASTFGPCDGRRHDSTMLQLSNVVGLFRNYLPGWCMYGDGAYPLCPEIIKPYGGANVTPQQAAWNAAMSAGRISVEWGFASVSRLWALCTSAKNTSNPKWKFLYPAGRIAVPTKFPNTLTALLQHWNSTVA